MPPEGAAETVVNVGTPGGTEAFAIQEPAVNAKALQDTAKTNRQAARAAVAAKITPNTNTAATAAKADAATAREGLIPERVLKLAKNAPEATVAEAASPVVADEVTTPPEPAATKAAAATTEAEQSRLDRVKEASRVAKKSAARNRSLLAEKTRLEGQIAQHREQSQRETAHLRQQAEQGQRLADTINRDPIAALKTLGYDEGKLAEIALAAGTPEARIQEMQRQWAADREAAKKEIEDLKNGLSQKERASQLAAAENACFAKAREADKYPNLQKFSRDSILFQVKDIAIRDREWYAKKGITVSRSDRQILAKLQDKQAK